MKHSVENLLFCTWVCGMAARYQLHIHTLMYSLLNGRFRCTNGHPVVRRRDRTLVRSRDIEPVTRARAARGTTRKRRANLSVGQLPEILGPLMYRTIM